MDSALSAVVTGSRWCWIWACACAQTQHIFLHIFVYSSTGRENCVSQCPGQSMFRIHLLISSTYVPVWFQSPYNTYLIFLPYNPSQHYWSEPHLYLTSLLNGVFKILYMFQLSLTPRNNGPVMYSMFEIKYKTSTLSSQRCNFKKHEVRKKTLSRDIASYNQISHLGFNNIFMVQK